MTIKEIIRDDKFKELYGRLYDKPLPTYQYFYQRIKRLREIEILERQGGITYRIKRGEEYELIINYIENWIKMKYKNDLIEEYCKGKKVLHIGAACSPDHKMLRESLLQSKLEVECDVVGVDNDREAVNYLRDKGFNIYYGDVEKGEYDVNLNTEFDYIIFSDVIEHLSNPGIALDNVKELMSENTKLILTTPNVFSYRNIKRYVTGFESVHPDHMFWPSEITMRRMLKLKGLYIDDFLFCFAMSVEDVSVVRGCFHLLISRMNNLLPCLFFIIKINNNLIKNGSKYIK